MGIQLGKSKGGYVFLENPREELMEMLVNKTRAVGHMVSFKEASEDPDLVDPNNFAFYYGSFSEAAAIAWRKVSKPKPHNVEASSAGTAITSTSSNKDALRGKATTQKPLIYTNLSIHKEVEPMHQSEQIHAKPNSDKKEAEAKQLTANRTDESPIIKHKGRPNKYNYENTIKLVVDFYKKSGRLPKPIEASSYYELPSWGTLCRILGSREKWDQIVQAELQAEILPPANNDESDSQDDTIPVAESSATTKSSDDEPSATISPKGLGDTESSNDESAPAPTAEPATTEPVTVEPATTESSDDESAATISTTEPVVTEPLKNEVVVSASPEEPFIGIKYDWNGNMLQVTVKVIKPGHTRPVYVTLSV